MRRTPPKGKVTQHKRKKKKQPSWSIFSTRQCFYPAPGTKQGPAGPASSHRTGAGTQGSGPPVTSPPSRRQEEGREDVRSAQAQPSWTWHQSSTHPPFKGRLLNATLTEQARRQQTEAMSILSITIMPQEHKTSGTPSIHLKKYRLGTG